MRRFADWPPASAVTWNWDTDTLFVLGDEGDVLVRISKTGAQLSVMTLTRFDDTEERLRDADLMDYVGGGSVARGPLASADLGTTTANIGIEGSSCDPRDGSSVTVKEGLNQDVNLATIHLPGRREPVAVSLIGRSRATGPGAHGKRIVRRGPRCTSLSRS